MRHSELFLDGPQGSGKTTTTNLLSSKTGLQKARGIPTGEELLRLERWQIWLRTVRLTRNRNNFISDRSIISLWAYDRRKFPEQSEKVDRSGLNILKVVLETHQNCCFILLDASPETCFDRQQPGKCKLSTIEEVRAEIEQYENIYKILQKAGQPVFRFSNEGTQERLIEDILTKI